MLLCCLAVVCAASQLVLTLTRRTPDQSKSPHRACFFEIQPWWWVILAPALSGSPVKVIMFPESRRREGWARHHFDGSSAQNLPNCSPPNESGLLNLKAIMFQEWGREGKGPSPYDRSAAFEHLSSDIIIVIGVLIAILINSIVIMVRCKIKLRVCEKNICQGCSIFSSHICEAIWVMG